MRSIIPVAVGFVFLWCNACADPSIEIRFEVPEKYKVVIQTVSLQVFEPPEGEDRPFSCDDLAFNKVDEDVMAASLTQTINIQSYPTSRKVELSGIDRTAYKIFLAKGYDEAGIEVVVGCEDVFVVRSKTEVFLEAEPTSAVVWLDGDPSGGSLVTPPPPSEMHLVVNDIFSDPLPYVDLQYTMVGPGGQFVYGKKSSDESGEVLLKPTAPERSGPSVLAIETRWQRSAFPLIRGFKESQNITVENLNAEVSAEDWYSDVSALPWPSGPSYEKIKIGKVGPDGEVGVAFINRIMDYSNTPPSVGDWYLFFQHLRGAPDDDSIELATEFNSIFGKNGLDVIEDEKADVPTLGIVREADRDKLILLTKSSWFEFVPGDPIQEGRFERLPSYSPPFEAKGPPKSIHDFGSCAQVDKTPLVLVSHENGYIGVYNTDSGELVEDNPFNDLAEVLQSKDGLSVRNAGCIADQTKQEHPAVYVRSEGYDESQSIVIDIDGEIREFPQSAGTLTASAFAPKIELQQGGEGEDGAGEGDTRVEAAQLLLGRLGSESPEVARLGLVAQQDLEESYIELADQDPLVAVPVTIAAGDVDGDYQGSLMRDVVGVFTTDVNDYTGEPADYFAHFILGSEYGGKRLSGTIEVGSLTANFEASNMPLIWLLDCDGNGIDDLIVFKANYELLDYDYYYLVSLEFHLM